MLINSRAASCSVPFVFSAASLLSKDPKTGEAVPWNPSPQRWIDGSVDNDLPMTRLAELFNVNHFIVSQVNPHVVPFLAKEEESINKEAHGSNIGPGPAWLHSLTHLAKGEALHRMHVMAELGIFPNTLTKAVSVLSQKYSGDITIFPDISYTDFPHMLSNPTTEFMLQAQLSGERATWPKLSRIKNHCAIELALDDAVHKLRARVAFSPSQVDLRLEIHDRSSDKRERAKEKAKSRQRPVSQNNAADDHAMSHQRHTSTRSNTNLTHKKALSTSTVLHEPSYQPTPFETAPLDTFKHVHDLTSSGAETSNLPTSTSSSTLSTSSPTDSPSPASPHSQPFNRDYLFPSASQPATPSFDLLGFCSKSPIPTPHHSPTLSNLSLSLSMTPKDPTAAALRPSSPEPRFKRLFHHRSTSQQNPPESRGKGADKAGEMKRKWGLNIDISGAKGIITGKNKGPQS